MKALIKGNIAVNIPGVTQPTNPSVSRYSISANMLRAASNAGAGRRPWGMLKIGVTDYVARRTMSSLQEALVRITFVDVEGERETVPGLPGQNILQVAEKHEIALDGPCEGRAGETQKRNSTTWTEDLFGQGPVCACCHVMIPKEFTDKIEPPLPHEIGLLERKGELYAPGASRLACQIKLSKELNGMTVYIPDGPPVS